MGPCPGTRHGGSLVHNRANALRAAKRRQEAAATGAATTPSPTQATVPHYATSRDATQFTVHVHQRLGAHSLAFAAFLETLRVRASVRFPPTPAAPAVGRRSHRLLNQHFSRGEIRADEVVEIMVRLLQVRLPHSAAMAFSPL